MKLLLPPATAVESLCGAGCLPGGWIVNDRELAVPEAMLDCIGLVDACGVDGGEELVELPEPALVAVEGFEPGLLVYLRLHYNYLFLCQMNTSCYRIRSFEIEFIELSLCFDKGTLEHLFGLFLEEHVDVHSDI